MNLRYLRTFISVAQCGSFSSAESSQYLSKQAIIKQIDQMEEELGFALFSRSPSGVTLTPAGSVFYTGSKQILELYDAILDRSRLVDSTSQKIRIELSNHPHTILEQVLQVFSETYPEIETEIIFHPGGDRHDHVRRSMVDISELAYSDPVNMQGLCYESLVRSPYCCVMSNHHPLAGHEELSLDQLNGYSVVVRRRQLRQEFFEYLEKTPHACTVEEHMGSELEALYNTCYNGGIYITPSFYTQSLTNLCAIPLTPRIIRDFGLVYRPDATAATLRFIKLAKKIYSENHLH